LTAPDVGDGRVETIRQLAAQIASIEQRLATLEARASADDDGDRCGWLRVDPDSGEVICDGVRAILRPGVGLDLLSSVSRRPGMWIGPEPVWGALNVNSSTVRNAAARLRTDLQRAGLPDLAERIEVSRGRVRIRIDER
jgi:hypothetical protein